MSYRLTHPRYLAGYWPLNNHADDVSGHGNNGVWLGSEDYEPGPYGHSVGEFAGTEDFVDIGSDILMSNTAWTVNAWINPDVTPNLMNLISGTAPTANSICQYIGTDPTSHLAFWDTGGSIWRLGNTVVPFGIPSMITYVYNAAGTVTFYLNAKNDGTGIIGPIYDDLYIRRIGIFVDAATRDWDGNIWNIRIYNIGLTGDEIINLYRKDKR